ncbi:hypothetical protein VaNZ11_008340 [Volvox africanus]|uniref:TatD related DNase n=1 Tax=Volvox africanus TaxID=51714 RepID=A0ABQ5S666_9CHLO|nr:hypothetical protein VaNZ11_008340 [Volvox africanus]
MWKRCLRSSRAGNTGQCALSTRSVCYSRCHPHLHVATRVAVSELSFIPKSVTTSIGMDDLLGRFGVSDAHCHPQDDPAGCAAGFTSLSARYLAVMGTRLEDWEAVEALSAKEPHKVIPCFGVHPWFAHRHALGLAAALDPSQLLDSPPNGKDHPSRHPEFLAPIPPDRWMPRLRSLLTDHPHAAVGEFGLDRAAVVPGTRLQPAWSHQLALTEMHLKLASELGRPASLHCVQGYGALQDMLRTLGPEGCPPRIMLHSYGGSVDLIKGFTKLPKGVGSRIYFSFSSVINGRARDKLLERLRAVPLERLLVESDQNSPLGVDPGLRAILEAVAEARGIAIEDAAAATTNNFLEFYGTCIERMEATQTAVASGD